MSPTPHSCSCSDGSMRSNPNNLESTKSPTEFHFRCVAPLYLYLQKSSLRTAWDHGASLLNCLMIFSLRQRNFGVQVKKSHETLAKMAKWGTTRFCCWSHVARPRIKHSPQIILVYYHRIPCRTFIAFGTCSLFERGEDFMVTHPVLLSPFTPLEREEGLTFSSKEEYGIHNLPNLVTPLEREKDLPSSYSKEKGETQTQHRHSHRHGK